LGCLDGFYEGRTQRTTVYNIPIGFLPTSAGWVQVGTNEWLWDSQFD
jgi:hypothetical protein